MKKAKYLFWASVLGGLSLNAGSVDYDRSFFGLSDNVIDSSNTRHSVKPSGGKVLVDGKLLGTSYRDYDVYNDKEGTSYAIMGGDVYKVNQNGRLSNTNCSHLSSLYLLCDGNMVSVEMDRRRYVVVDRAADGYVKALDSISDSLEPEGNGHKYDKAKSGDIAVGEFPEAVSRETASVNVFEAGQKPSAGDFNGQISDPITEAPDKKKASHKYDKSKTGLFPDGTYGNGSDSNGNGGYSEGGSSTGSNGSIGGYTDRGGNYHDGNGGYTDRDGNYHDGNGGYTDRNGGYHDRNGGYTDRDGNYHEPRDGGYYDEDGKFIETGDGGGNPPHTIDDPNGDPTNPPKEGEIDSPHTIDDPNGDPTNPPKEGEIDFPDEDCLPFCEEKVDPCSEENIENLFQRNGGLRTSNVNFENPMDFYLNNQFYRNGKEYLSDVVSQCGNFGIGLSANNLQFPMVATINEDLTRGISQVSDMIVGTLENLTSPEMIMAAEIQLASYVVTGIKCVGKVIDDDQVKSALAKKIAACEGMDVPPEVEACGKTQVGSHTSGGAGTNLEIDPMASLGCAAKAIKELELVPVFAACYETERPKFSQELFTKLRQRIQTRKSTKSKVIRQCQLDKDREGLFDYSLDGGEAVMYSGFKGLEVTDCYNSYTGRDAVKECILRSQYASRTDLSDEEKSALEKEVESMVVAMEEEQSARKAAFQKRLQIAHKIIRKDVFFMNAKIQNVFDDYYRYASYYMEGATEHRLLNENFKRFCQATKGQTSQQPSDPNSPIDLSCNPFTDMTIGDENVRYSLPQDSILANTEREFTKTEVRSLRELVEKFNSSIIYLMTKGPNDKELDAALINQLAEERGNAGYSDKEDFTMDELGVVYRQGYLEEMGALRSEYADIQNPEEAAYFSSENQSCDSLRFNLNITGFILDEIREVVQPYLENFMFNSEPGVEYDDAAKFEEMVNLFFDTFVFGPMCLYETGQNPFLVTKITNQAQGCMENLDMGDLDFGGETGIDMGVAFPMPDGETRTKPCVNVSSIAKSVNCMANIKMDIVDTEFRACLEGKRTEFFDMKSLNMKKYTKYDFAIKNENRRTCELKNRVIDTQINIEAGLSGIEVAVGTNFIREQLGEINRNVALSKLQSEYLNNEINRGSSPIFKNIIEPIALYNHENANLISKEVDDSAMLSAYEFALKNWFYGVGELYIKRMPKKDSFPYAKEFPDESETVGRGLKDVSAGLYKYNVSSVVPSNLLVEMRTLPETLDIEKRFRAADIFCNKVGARLDMAATATTFGSNPQNDTLSSWVNNFNELLYYSIFLQGEDKGVFRLADGRRIPYNTDPVSKADFILLKKAVDGFCSDIRAAGMGYLEDKVKTNKMVRRMETVIQDFVQKPALKEVNQEEVEKRTGEQVVDTPAQQEIKTKLDKGGALIKKMEEEIDLYTEGL